MKTREEFLDKKRDYSPFLVHLTRAGVDCLGDVVMPVEEILQMILDQKTLQACNYYCLFDRSGSRCLDTQDNSIKNKFRVVCFTETPIDQVEVLLEEAEWKNKKYEPYGLVFKKEYIKEKGGNHVFYVSNNLFEILWEVFDSALDSSFSKGENKFLALVNRCDEKYDFHWEREWRIVGNLEFEYQDVYCGLCPEAYMPFFEDKYPPILFIDPNWGINKILDKLVTR